MLKGNDFVEWEQTLWVEPIIDFNISLFREAPYNLHPRRFWMEKHVKRAWCESFQIYQEKIIALAASLGSYTILFATHILCCMENFYSDT